MYSESKHLHCKHHCMCGCVCVRCVRKTETRSLHGGIPLLEETPLCSTPSSQEDIMGTAAGLFSHLWKMPSILHMSIEIGIFLSHLLVFTSHEKTSLTSDSPMHFTWGQSSLSGVVCAWKVTLEGAEPPTEQAHHMLPRTPTDPTYTHPPQAECIPERKSRESLPNCCEVLSLSRSTPHHVVWACFKMLHFTHSDSPRSFLSEKVTLDSS